MSLDPQQRWGRRRRAIPARHADNWRYQGLARVVLIKYVMSVTKTHSSNRREADAAEAPAGAQARPQSLLHLPTWSRLRVASKQRAVLGRGGDFFEVFQHRDERVAVVMADVCGNGPGAAAHVSDIRWALRQQLARGEAPGAVLSAGDGWLGWEPGSHRV